MIQANAIHEITEYGPSADVILAFVGADALATDVIRSARGMAYARNASLVICYPKAHIFNAASDIEAMNRSLKQAERAGAELVPYSPLAAPQELLEIIHKFNSSQVVLARDTRKPGWLPYCRNPIAGLLQICTGVDVHVVTPPTEHREATGQKSTPFSIIISVLTPIFMAALSYLTTAKDESLPVGFLFLLGIFFVSARYRIIEALITATLSSIFIEVMYLRPLFGGRAPGSGPGLDVRFAFILSVLMVISIVIFKLADTSRSQTKRSDQMNEHATALSKLSQDLLGCKSLQEIMYIARRNLQTQTHFQVWIYIVDGDGRLMKVQGANGTSEQDKARLMKAQSLFDNQHGAAHRANPKDFVLEPGAGYFFLNAIDSCIGIIELNFPHGMELDKASVRLLQTMVDQISLAVERFHYETLSHSVSLRSETNQIRDSLLSLVSHDLRTPLSIISVAAENLCLAKEGANSEEMRWAEMIKSEVARLDQQVNRLLEFARLQSVSTMLEKEWHSVDDIIYAAISAVEDKLVGHEVVVEVEEDATILADSSLVEQALCNLLENAAKYSESGTIIKVKAKKSDETIRITVEDQGSGLVDIDVNRIFDPFYRSTNPCRKGMGLGLAICRTVVNLHGGNISANHAEESGTIFTLELPRGQGEPHLEYVN